jgi:hypothetical protein
MTGSWLREINMETSSYSDPAPGPRRSPPMSDQSAMK